MGGMFLRFCGNVHSLEKYLIPIPAKEIIGFTAPFFVWQVLVLSFLYNIPFFYFYLACDYFAFISCVYSPFSPSGMAQS